MLRIIGQHWVEDHSGKLDDLPAPRLKKVSRRRIRTVMQDLIYMAGRIIDTAREQFISFGRLNPFAGIWGRIYYRLARSAAPA